MATDGHPQAGTPQHWQMLYSAALHEVDIDRLPRRIQDAELEISAEMKRSSGFQTGPALLDVLSALRDLEQISQAFPVYASGNS
jgi:hypothetical protein